MTDASDEQLVAQALAGGPTAFSGLVQRYRSQIAGVAFARLGDFDEAEDVAQQVFVEAFECLHLLKDPQRVGQWLRTAAIHRSVDVLRRRRDVTDPETANLRSPSNPEEELERQETRQLVRSAIGRLSVAQRETVTLFYLAGHKIDDVAALQDVPVGTVKRRLHDARQRMKVEMLTMVEETLSNEAPTEDFSDRVFELLTQFYQDPSTWPWRQVVAESQHDAASAEWEKQVGSRFKIHRPEDLVPFERGMKHPHAMTRRHTVGTLYYLFFRSDTTDEGKAGIKRLLLQALDDPNKKIRVRTVLWVLGRGIFSQDEIETEVIPRLLPMLQDPSRRVRMRVAIELRRRVQYVPLSVAAAALARHPEFSHRRLVETVLEAA